MNNHQESSFYPLGNFLNPALALLGQGLRKLPSGQKLNFSNHPYLCKGLYVCPIQKTHWFASKNSITYVA
ncbi:hypothetical protein THERMOT_1684 [Bathymodiolus thermophilus thioautotrophic gill symbiont]|uniref:hypothetical protein n=1 Tax=Bathymodiolus thermophilus thioautotrophic gill symbiont TaxID=2360 RepID=UPI00192B4FE5|nr:hypothetical protein [Bathymodiolus thermophilus thioautotrophic gill symbiont]CAB5502812.1 hypothetical protein THERMOT_1684 [Bathymodiolus thermophilus thioautotrophic gill symbiont]